MSDRPMTPDEFRTATGVDGPTVERLGVYGELLHKWQRSFNLVGRDTLNDPWRRHMLDSAQLFPLLPRDGGALVDLGSGAGFPGLVLAIMGGAAVHLVESNGKKCAFLAEVIRSTGADAEIHQGRIESIRRIEAKTVTARALAPLPRLLGYASKFGYESTRYLFLKGRRWEAELTESQKNWTMTASSVPSLTEPGGVILRLEGLTRRHDSE